MLLYSIPLLTTITEALCSTRCMLAIAHQANEALVVGSGEKGVVRLVSSVWEESAGAPEESGQGIQYTAYSI